jgi:hypothetical protein
MSRRVRDLLLCLICGVILATPVPAAPQAVHTYTDPVIGLTFTYPASFGEPTRGSDHGFAERRAAVRFAAINGEAVLTEGLVLVDFQAVSALYDHFALQVLPDAERQRITGALPPLSAGSFCAALAAADHTVGSGLPEALLAAARRVDVMQRHHPRVETCVRQGQVIRFSRAARATDAEGAPESHVFGAIRFLDGRYSSFQIVSRAATSPATGLLGAMTAVVESLQVR